METELREMGCGEVVWGAHLRAVTHLRHQHNPGSASSGPVHPGSALSGLHQQADQNSPECPAGPAACCQTVVVRGCSYTV